VSPEKRPEASLFPDEKTPALPAEQTVLAYLAQTLSIPKTLKRFPSLTLKNLQEILDRCALRAGKERMDLPAPSAPPRAGEVVIYTDGASRGNPGEAGVGAVIADERGKTLKEIKQYLGMATNNVAEYRAVILALEKAFALGAAGVMINLDSELVARQITGEYRVRDAQLKSLHQQVLDLLKNFSKHRIRHIPREQNRRADQLANEAIDQKIRS
jgi:ribonuclease HI